MLPHFYLLQIYYTDQGASNVNQLIDTTPTPNWILLGSKFLAIVKMQLVLLSLSNDFWNIISNL